MYQTPLFISNTYKIDFEETAIDIMKHIHENKILNINFNRGQGKTTALTTLAYLGAKYTLFDKIFYLAPVRELTHEFPRIFKRILEVYDEDPALYKETSKQAIEFNNCGLFSLSFNEIKRGYMMTPETLILIDEVQVMSESSHNEIRHIIKNSTIVTATTGNNQRFFLSR